MEIQSDVVWFNLKFIARGLPYDFKVLIKDIYGRKVLMIPSRVNLYMSKFYCQGALVRVKWNVWQVLELPVVTELCRRVDSLCLIATQGGLWGVKGSSRTLKRFRDYRSPPWHTWSLWAIVEAVHRVQLYSLSSCNGDLNDPAICPCYLDKAGCYSILCPLDGGIFNASSCVFYTNFVRV